MEEVHYVSGDDVDPILLVELLDEHDADIVAQLNEQDLETTASILSQFPLERAVDIFDRPELSRAGDIILELRDLEKRYGPVLALKPAAEDAIAYKRDYEERARELAEEIVEEEAETASSTELFTDAAANEAAAAKKLAATRRQQSLMQGYTGNECSECHNFTMVRNGTCEKCDTCGSTSGCS